jgi:hypothetical protein
VKRDTIGMVWDKTTKGLSASTSKLVVDIRYLVAGPVPHVRYPIEASIKSIELESPD